MVENMLKWVQNKDPTMTEQQALECIKEFYPSTNPIFNGIQQEVGGIEKCPLTSKPVCHILDELAVSQADGQVRQEDDHNNEELLRLIKSKMYKSPESIDYMCNSESCSRAYQQVKNNASLCNVLRLAKECLNEDENNDLMEKITHYVNNDAPIPEKIRQIQGGEDWFKSVFSDPENLYKVCQLSTDRDCDDYNKLDLNTFSIEDMNNIKIANKCIGPNLVLYGSISNSDIEAPKKDIEQLKNDCIPCFNHIINLPPTDFEKQSDEENCKIVNKCRSCEYFIREEEKEDIIARCDTMYPTLVSS